MLIEPPAEDSSLTEIVEEGNIVFLYANEGLRSGDGKLLLPAINDFLFAMEYFGGYKTRGKITLRAYDVFEIFWNVLGEEEFTKFGNGKILINTSLGLTFDKSAFENWISNQNNFAIFDGDGIGKYKQEFDKFKNVISTEVVSGWTKEAQERLSMKVLDNLIEYINNYGS